MNILNTLAGWQWLLLAAVPLVIVALYFLKLRRQPLEVPSTYLWTRTIEDLHVNSLWQRLRQNLLLFLQLLLVATAILACLRPGWRGTQLADNRFIFLLDTSASMSATDVAPTRLDAAKHRAIDLVNRMKSGDAAMVISFSDVARIEQSFTDNRSLLRQKINRIRATNRRSDLQDALRAAAGLANPGRTSSSSGDVQVAEALPATLYLFSDGGFAAVPNFSLGNLKPNYITLGSPQPDNLAIVAFTTDRNPDKPGKTQVFARIENTGPKDVTADVALLLNGELADASQVAVSTGGEVGVEFQLTDIEEGVLRLEIQRKDVLPLDNVAYAAVGIPRRARALLFTPKNESLRFAVTTDEAQKVAEVTFATPPDLESKSLRDLAAAGAYDLVIYDQCQPAEMPQANTLFIGNVPRTDGWSKGQRKELPVIIDTDRAHPITQLVEMGNVKWIYDGYPLQGPPGSTVLFDSNAGPLLVIGQREGYEDAVLGFEIVGKDVAGEVIAKTDWPSRRSFPLFVMNMLRYLGGQRGSQALAGVQPGAPISLRPRAPTDRLDVVSPSGVRSSLSRQGQSEFLFASTEELGIYDVMEGREPTASQRFAVNLFDGRESDLRPRPAVELGYERIAGRAGTEPARTELWKWLVLAGLGVLLTEWYVYNRRVYV